MEILKYLQRLGFSPDLKQHPVGRGVEFLYINNPDGTIRWLWPASVKEPLFLKFFHAGNTKGKIRKWLVKQLFSVGLHRWVFNRVRVDINPVEQTIVPASGQWALFTGTPGPNRKIIAYAVDGNQRSFYKIPLGENSAKLLANEITTLEWLRAAGITTFNFPLLKGYRLDAAEISDISSDGRRNSSFEIWHERALLELQRKSGNRASIRSLDIWKETIQNLSVLKLRNDDRIPKGLIRKLQYVIDQIDDTKEIDTALAHGDFTPWNMYQSGATLSIYDWELSNPAMPLGFDAFHFIIQNGILVERKPWRDLSGQIDALLQRVIFTKYSAVQRQLYLELYLVINTIHYLSVYANQESWHVQVSWLIQTWSEALTDILASKFAHRRLLAMDFFDALSGSNCAVLKGDNGLPENLDENSDIDICISRRVYRTTVRNFLEQYQLVAHRETVGKSFMATERVVLRDGTMLCMDFIWQFKRTGLQFMNASAVVKNSQLNRLGISMAHKLDDARYVGFFYALNSRPIPDRYQYLASELTSSRNPEDHLLSEFYHGQVEVAANIASVVRAMKSNKGINGVRNQFNYIMDAGRDLFRRRGMVITFSGVDGAGKSTIIENLKYKIEKQLRKRVVVLRHRPSLLPILSAWTKGKKAAETEAASRLPRLGQNKSVVSSLLRFAYYYADYLIGQYYVLVKHVWRGDVVLYDRYYFDFINDGKRSNINLPPNLVSLGYSFILKPDYNFFLYASPEMILSRKKELDAETIGILTNKYLDLFKKLSRGAADKYIPIENIEMPATIGTIFAHVNRTPVLS